MFGIEKDFQKLMEQAYGRTTNRKVERTSKKY